jgi:asparagine synthase (glutamine-hydrolysing)
MTPQEYRIHELVNLRLPRLLKWEDRNSMAFSIESRVPFLDVNLLEFVLSINPELNMRAGWTKYLFRKSASDYLPKKICWRKDKKGFETPQSKWMKKGPFHNVLTDWAQKKEHPVSEYIDTDFASVYNALLTGTFDSNALFRLFCLDQWLLTVL